jgi:hypothetical protein
MCSHHEFVMCDVLYPALWGDDWIHELKNKCKCKWPSLLHPLFQLSGVRGDT